MRILQNFGGPVFLDAEDYERFKDRVWYLHVDVSKQSLINRIRIKGGNKRKYELIYRLILGYSGRRHVDHKNRCPWDCTRTNLGLKTSRENNIRHAKRNVEFISQYVGVTLTHGKWTAKLRFSWNNSLYEINLKTFTEESAASVVDFVKFDLLKTRDYRFNIKDRISIEELLKCMDISNRTVFISIVYILDKGIYYTNRFNRLKCKYRCMRRLANSYELSLNRNGEKVALHSKSDVLLALIDEFSRRSDFNQCLLPPPGVEPLSTREEFDELLGEEKEIYYDWVARVKNKEEKKNA